MKLRPFSGNNHLQPVLFRGIVNDPPEAIHIRRVRSHHHVCRIRSRRLKHRHGLLWIALSLLRLGELLLGDVTFLYGFAIESEKRRVVPLRVLEKRVRDFHALSGKVVVVQIVVVP